MSCRTTPGGSASLSLARRATGLSDRDAQHLFHALKREGEGLPDPTVMEATAWLRRQRALVNYLDIPETQRASLHARLTQAGNQHLPDGAMFHAWNGIEARARATAVVRSITNAVDLEPPGSQAAKYTLGPDGRPTHVMYASYGSNMRKSRLMTYIKGGSLPNSRVVYPGCTNQDEPDYDIPIRYSGYRSHFALTSSVWRGGIAFLDESSDPEAAALGRAYRIPIQTFDELTHFENGGRTRETVQPVNLSGVLKDGDDVIGPGAYQRLVHIGDHSGMPVLTFTSPFTAEEAILGEGTLSRPTGDVPVRTSRPSAAYVQMIGKGLHETFRIGPVKQADYMRGMPGCDRYTRAELVSILRAEPLRRPRGVKARTSTAKTADKPAAKTTAKPAVSVAKPAERTAKPAERTTKPAAKPISRPSATPARPAATKVSPTEDAAYIYHHQMQDARRRLTTARRRHDAAVRAADAAANGGASPRRAAMLQNAAKHSAVVLAEREERVRLLSSMRPKDPKPADPVPPPPFSAQ